MLSDTRENMKTAATAIHAAKETIIAWMHEHDVSTRIAIQDQDILKWMILSGASAASNFSVQDLNNIVNLVMQEYCGVRDPGDNLTVGQLRAVMRQLPDGMPVFYECIEDSYFNTGGWTTTILKTGDTITDPEHSVPAFSASVATDREGKTVLSLTAHY